MICAAKPRNAAAPTIEHLRVLAPRLVAPSTSVASPFHAPGEIVLKMRQRRVLLARIKDELREVQARRCVTQVQGSLKPLLRLAHSIIIARRCGRTRSWQLRSTSSTPSHVGPDLNSERYTHAQRCVCLIRLVLHFLCHIILLREVRDRAPIVPRAVVAVSEVAARPRHPRAVPQRLGHRPALLVQLARPPIVPVL